MPASKKPLQSKPASGSLPSDTLASTTVAGFEIKYVQYLNEQAKIVNALPAFAQDYEYLLKLFRTMKTLQQFDHKVLMLHRTGKIGTYTGTLGQEAVGVGAASCLSDKDVFVPYYRSTTDLYVRGARLHEILLYWGGDERGSDFKDPRLKDDLPIPISIGTQLLHAAGVATAIKLRKQSDRAVLTMTGDGGTSEGDFYEAINVSGAWQLPLVFIINNNQWALSEPNQAQTACQTLAQKAIAGGIEGIQVDGNDVIAVKAVTEAALNKARKGGGPTLIEAITYRLCSHTTVDNMDRYVNKLEYQQAALREPLIRLRKLLQSQGLLDEDSEGRMTLEIKEEIDAEVETFLNTPPQPPEHMFDYLYAELPESLQAQRAEAIKQEE